VELSDEAPRPAAEGELVELRRVPTGLYLHNCEHPGCDRWGAWGFPRNSAKDTIWFCTPHKPA